MNYTVAVLFVVVLISTSISTLAAQPQVEFRRQFVTGEFGQVHVLSSRPMVKSALKTTVVCFAPNPATGRYFRMFMEQLGQDRIMIAPDYPGLGESDAPEEIPELAGYAGAMADVLTALGYGDSALGKVDICGYHTGAMVAVELAVSRPDLVRKLVLMGIPFYSGEERERMYREYVIEKPISEDFSELEDSWEFAVTNREKGVTLDRAYDNFVDVLKAQDRRHWAYHAVFSYPAEERALLVMQPVLILNTHGSLKDQTRAMAPLFPKAELIEIPELHHGIFDVGADILAARARLFLDQPVP